MGANAQTHTGKRMDTNTQTGTHKRMGPNAIPFKCSAESTSDGSGRHHDVDLHTHYGIQAYHVRVTYAQPIVLACTRTRPHDGFTVTVYHAHGHGVPCPRSRCNSALGSGCDPLSVCSPSPGLKGRTAAYGGRLGRPFPGHCGPAITSLSQCGHGQRRGLRSLGSGGGSMTSVQSESQSVPRGRGAGAGRPGD
jgi:hypothetical protein